MRHRRPVLMTAAALCAAVAPTSAHALAPGRTVLLDRAADGRLGDDGTNYSILASSRSLSADGNRAVFESEADGLHAPEGDRTARYVYVRDRAAGTVTNACRSTAGTLARGGGCWSATISPNGRFVVFVSPDGKLDPSVSASGTNHPYERDLQTSTTVLVGRKDGPAGAPDPGYTSSAAVADNGAVAFATSTALDAADTNGVEDVYLRTPGATRLLSRTGAAGAVGNGASSDPDISGDGTTVAFSSQATNLSGADGNTRDDIYTVPAAGGTPALQSRKVGAGAVGDQGSSHPSLSQTGRYVAFATAATNLFSAPSTTDANGHSDVLLRDTVADTNTNASLLSGGVTQLNGDSYLATISADGGSVVYASLAANVGAPGQYQPVAVVRRTGTATTTVASRGNGAKGAVVWGDPSGLSADGNVVLFDTGALDPVYTDQVYARVVGTGVTDQVSRRSAPALEDVADSDVSDVSADGRFTVVHSGSRGLVPEVSSTEGYRHLYLRDGRTGALTLIDHAAGAPSASNGDSEGTQISADGEIVAFTSSSTDLVGGVTDGHLHAYVWRRSSGAITAEDRGTTGGVVGKLSEGGLSLSADGRSLAFATDGALDPADANGTFDAYVRDLASGTTTLVSRADGAAGAVQSTGAYTVATDGTGRHVAFSTTTSLNAADGNTTLDTYVRDVATNTTTLVSRANGAAGAVGNGSSMPLSLSADGTRIALGSLATNLGDGVTNGTHWSIRVRDLSAGTTVWASRLPGGAQPNDDAYGGSLSADGTHLAFVTTPPGVTPGDTGQVYVRDLAASDPVLVSTADDTGAPITGDAFGPVLSDNGACVVYSARGTGVVPGGYPSPDYSHAYLRSLSDACAPDPVATPTAGPALADTADRTAPVLGKLTASRKAFATKGKRKGTVLTVTSSEAATGSLTIAALSTGRKGSGKHRGECAKPTAKNRKAKACQLVGKAKPVRTVALRAGTTTIALDGKVGGKRLKAGHYRLSLTATDAAGNATKAPVTLDVTVR